MIKSFAKINLFLEVLQKTSDSYHLISSLMTKISLYDILHFAKQDHEGFSISSTNDNLPCNEDNLCYKAYELFTKKSNLNFNYHLHIEKNIPIAAGLGGGSSNAAATLKFLNTQSNDYFTDEQLHDMAATLGCDVPFFLNRNHAIVSNKGEMTSFIDHKLKLYGILLCWKFPISAAWAYQNCKTYNQSRISVDEILSLLEKRNNAPSYNALSYAIFDKFPLLEKGLETLQKTKPTLANISGSGPSLYAVYYSQEEQEKAFNYLQQQNFLQSKIIKYTIA